MEGEGHILRTWEQGFFFPKLGFQKFGEFFQNFSKIIEFVVEQKHLPKTPNYFVEKKPKFVENKSLHWSMKN